MKASPLSQTTPTNQEADVQNGAEETRLHKTFEKREAYYRALIVNTLDVIIVLNEYGTLMFVSPAMQRVLQYTPDEVTGTSILTLIHPGDVNAFRKSLAQACEQPERQRHLRIIDVRKPDGTLTWNSIHVEPLLHDGEAVP